MKSLYLCMGQFCPLKHFIRVGLLTLFSCVWSRKSVFESKEFVLYSIPLVYTVSLVLSRLIETGSERFIE